MPNAQSLLFNIRNHLMSELTKPDFAPVTVPPNLRNLSSILGEEPLPQPEIPPIETGALIGPEMPIPGADLIGAPDLGESLRLSQDLISSDIPEEERERIVSEIYGHTKLREELMRRREEEEGERRILESLSPDEKRRMWENILVEGFRKPYGMSEPPLEGGFRRPEVPPLGGFQREIPAPPTAKGGEITDIKFERKGDAVGREYHETVYAVDPKTRKKMGYVKHSYSQGESSVQMIEVEPEYRKKGIGLALLNELQAQSEKPLTIMGNFATKEGQALWNKFQGQSKLSPKEVAKGGEITDDPRNYKMVEDYLRVNLKKAIDSKFDQARMKSAYVSAQQGKHKLGTVGDFIVDEKMRERFKDVLNIPVFSNNELSEKNPARLISFTGDKKLRTEQAKAGTPSSYIEIGPAFLSGEGAESNFIHEVIHARRNYLGRQMGGVSEKSAQSGARFLEDETAKELTQVWNASKLSPKEVAKGGEIEYYHTTNQESADLIKQKGFEARVGDRSLGSTKGNGVWIYENEGHAKEFGKNFKNPAVIKTKVDGKIFDATNDDRGIREIAEDTKLINKLKSEGYVGITGDELGVNATFIFEPSKLSPVAKGGEITPKVLYRGMMKDGKGAGTSSLGKGLYSSPDKSFLKNYKFDKIVELTPEEAYPKNPLIIDTKKQSFEDWLLEKSGEKNIRDFNKKYTKEDFVSSQGYDGVVAGNEVVKYSKLSPKEPRT